MVTLKELQKNLGSAAKGECTERTTLKEIGQQLSASSPSKQLAGISESDCISDPAAIREILDHILWRDIEEFNGRHGVVSNPFFSVEVETFFIGPPVEFGSLFDHLTVVCYYSMYLEDFKNNTPRPIDEMDSEYRFAKRVWRLFAYFGKRDKWFGLFNRINISRLQDFLRLKDAPRMNTVPDIVRPFGDAAADYVDTIGDLIEEIGERFGSCWDPGAEPLGSYADWIKGGCRAMQSLINAIVTAYCDPASRIAVYRENGHDKLRELLEKERKLREELAESRQAG